MHNLLTADDRWPRGSLIVGRDRRQVAPPHFLGWHPRERRNMIISNLHVSFR